MSRPGEAAPPRLRLASALEGRVVLGQVWACPVSVAPTEAGLQGEIDTFATALRRKHAARSPAETRALQPAREFYRLFKIDPTKLRPSSEALLRRVLREKPLPRISNAVDLGNLLALRYLLPIGLYDAAKIDGDVRLETGSAGQSYVGVRKDEVHLEGRPVLIDRRGPFGNPTADSLRTAVDESTRALWMVVFAPSSVATSVMKANLDLAEEAMRRHLGHESARVETRAAITGP